MALSSEQWQLGSQTLQHRMGYLLISGQGSDCKFLVGTKFDQEAIEAHKAILASASPVFDAMFYGGIPEQSPILIPDIQPETFRKLLRYIYVGAVEITSFEKAWELYYAAKKYILPYLLKECTKYILLCSQLVSVTYILPTYEFSVLYDDKELIEKCLHLFGVDTREVLTAHSFNKAQLSTVITILSLEKNDCIEIDLFRALERYAKAQEEQRIEKRVDRNDNNNPLMYNKDSAGCSDSKDIVVAGVAGASGDHGEETDPEELRKQVDLLAVTEFKEKPNFRAALEKIRFLTFTATEFAEGPAKSSLLTESEKWAILMNITTDKSAVPMPSGFSTNKNKRPSPS